MSNMESYVQFLLNKAGGELRAREIFAKILSKNDDSGRHGVLIPTDAYSFFPEMRIPNEEENYTGSISAFDALADARFVMPYKYYERYPERRLTRLNPVINNTDFENKRLVVALKCSQNDGSSLFVMDYATSENGRFDEIFRIIFGDGILPETSHFIISPVAGRAFEPDEALLGLLQRFDTIREMGFIKTLRSGSTGIGFTFESLLEIKENNKKDADYKGIEIKCKGIRDGAQPGKINLFQQSPTWATRMPAKDRIKSIGYPDEAGLYACHSQVTPKANHHGLMLEIQNEKSKIDLYKDAGSIGHWAFSLLEKRLLEKHSRAVFVKAHIKESKGDFYYKYDELIYCDQPDIHRFVNLVSRGNIVFEFLMSQKPDGSVRNHGYPWRLLRFELLNELFSFQIKLR